MFGAYRRTCGIVGGCAKAIGKDIARWWPLRRAATSSSQALAVFEHGGARSRLRPV